MILAFRQYTRVKEDIPNAILRNHLAKLAIQRNKLLIVYIQIDNNVYKNHLKIAILTP